MPVLRRKEDNEPVLIPNEQLGEAVNSGEYVTEGVRVDVVTPDGGTISVPIGEALVRLEQGGVAEPVEAGSARGRQERVQEHFGEGLGANLAAGGLGVAGGFTLGTSNALFEALGAPVEELQQANPVLSPVTEGVGSVIPAFVTGGAAAGGTAARLGATLAKTPAGIVTRAASRAGGRIAARGGRAAQVAGSAAEGAIDSAAFASGMAVSDAVVSDDPLTAESIASRITAETALGGAFGGTLGALGTVSKRFSQSKAGQHNPLLDPRTDGSQQVYDGLGEHVRDLDSQITPLARDEERVVTNHAGRLLEETEFDDVQVSPSGRVTVVPRGGSQFSPGEQPSEFTPTGTRIIPRGDTPAAPSTDTPTAAGGAARDVPTPDVAQPQDSSLPRFDDLGDEPQVMTVRVGDIAPQARMAAEGGDAPVSVRDEGRAQAIEEALDSGVEPEDLDPVQVSLSPSGRVDVIDGVHRLAVLNEMDPDFPVRVRFERGVDAAADTAETLSDDPGMKGFGAPFRGSPEDWLRERARFAASRGSTGETQVESPLGFREEQVLVDPRRRARIQEARAELEGVDPETGEVLADRTQAAAPPEFTPQRRQPVRTDDADATGVGKRSPGRQVQGEEGAREATPSPTEQLGVEIGLDEELQPWLPRGDKARRARELKRAARTKAKPVIKRYEDARANLARHLGDDLKLDGKALVRKRDNELREVSDALDEFHIAARELEELANPTPVQRRTGSLITDRDPTRIIERAVPPEVRQALLRAKKLRVEDLNNILDGADLPDAQSPAGQLLVRAYALGRLGSKHSAKKVIEKVKEFDQQMRRAGNRSGGGIGGFLGRSARQAGRNVAFSAMRQRGIPSAGSIAMAAASSPAFALMELASGAGAVMNQVKKAVDGFLDTAAKPGFRRRAIPTASAILAQTRFGELDEDEEDTATKRIKELAKTVGNPDEAQARIDENLAPLRANNIQLGYEVGDRLGDRLRFLHEKAPKLPSKSPVVSSRWKPSGAQLQKFARYVRAAERPLDALEDIQNGNVTVEAVETLKTVYPSIFQEFQRQLAERVGELRQDLPYQSRLQLSILFDVPVESSVRPETVAMLQQMHQAKDEQAMQGGTIGPTSKRALNDLPGAEGTKGQRLSER